MAKKQQSKKQKNTDSNKTSNSNKSKKTRISSKKTNKKFEIQLPNTGNKLVDVIVLVIIALCILAIISYTYYFIYSLTRVKVAPMFMCIIFGMLFFSIIQYAVKFFIQNKRASLAPLLSSFSTSVLMSTISVSNVENSLFVTALLITIIIPFMSNDLTFTRRCFVVITIVFILCIAWTLLKLNTGSNLLTGTRPIENMYYWFDTFRTIIVWTMFSVLFFMRFYLLKNKYKNQIDEIGYDLFMKNYRNKMEEFAIEDAIAEIKNQSKKNEKARGKAKQISKKTNKESDNKTKTITKINNKAKAKPKTKADAKTKAKTSNKTKETKK